MSRARQTEERAAQWIMRREEPAWSNDDQRELDGWLAESDANKAAFWRLDYGWRQADRIAALGPAAKPPMSSGRFGMARWQPFAIAASLLMIFAAFALPGPLRGLFGDRVEAVEFATALGGHRRADLADGSRIELNTATVVRAAIGDDSRIVWIDHGEAFFEVARKAGIPFVVHAGSRTVSVLGTKFAVRRDGERTIVSVLEGAVRLDEGPSGSHRSATLAAGDLAVADGRETLVTKGRPEAVQRLLAWRNGRLLFDQTSLADAAEQFNRYNRRQLVVEDSVAARIRIGGSFDARNVDAFARLLHDAYGLEVQAGPEKIAVSD